MASGTGRTWVIPKRGDGSLWMQDLVPVLSSPASSNITTTSATVSVVASRGGGNLYYVVTNNATPPSAAQIIAGQNNAGSAAVRSGSVVPLVGPQSFALSALSGAQAFYAYFVHVVSGFTSTVAAAAPFTLTSIASSWGTIPDQIMLRAGSFPKYINNIRTTYFSGGPASAISVEGSASGVWTYDFANDRLAVTADPTVDIDENIRLNATVGGSPVRSNYFRAQLLQAYFVTNPPSQILVPEGGFYDLAQHMQGVPASITDAVAEPSGVTIEGPFSAVPRATWRFEATANAPIVPASGAHVLTLNQNAVADWNARIAGPGVVWYHNFDNAAEVSQFRYSTGNDPAGTHNGGIAQNIRWVASGGADGGGYMENLRLAGLAETGSWWRPLSPLTGATNGRGVDDPGCPTLARLGGGTLVPQAFLPNSVSNINETRYWARNTRAQQGWYGHSSVSNSFFDGDEFYFQVRVRTDPRRTNPGSPQGCKKIWFSGTWQSHVEQEIVTYACFTGSGTNTPGPAGARNYHNGYIGRGFTEWSGINACQIGSDIAGVCDPRAGVNTGCWSYSTDGTWDTILYHITPTSGVRYGNETTPAGTNTRIQVYVARSTERAYTKIWDVLVANDFTQGTGGGSQATIAESGLFMNQFYGWNAILLSTYSNGDAGAAATTSDFYEHFDQAIFSRQFIPCPQV